MKKSTIAVILNRNNFPVEIALTDGEKILLAPRQKADIELSKVNKEKLPLGIVVKE